MQNQWPYQKRMPERAGEASRHFDGDASTGMPGCEYEDKDLGEFATKASQDLNRKSGAGWEGQQPPLPGGAGIKFGASSSVQAHETVEVVRPGSTENGGRTPRVQKLAPHSD